MGTCSLQCTTVYSKNRQWLEASVILILQCSWRSQLMHAWGYGIPSIVAIVKRCFGSLATSSMHDQAS